jgi:hypothetical protein
MTHLFTLAYADGAKLQLAVPDPALFAQQITSACGTNGATHAQFGHAAHPVVIALQGIRAVYASLPGEFPDAVVPDATSDVELVASVSVPSTFGVTNVIQQPPMTLTMPPRRSETTVERDPETSEIVRSTTLETSVVPDDQGASRPAAELN